MNSTAPYQSTVLGGIKSGRIVWHSLNHAEKSALVDRAILNREHTGIDAMSSVHMLWSIIDSDRQPGTYLYMFAARSVELRGLEQVGREIAEAKGGLRLARCFIEAYGIEKAPLLGSDLANKVKGALLEDHLGL
jgi:hypothetical protein